MSANHEAVKNYILFNAPKHSLNSVRARTKLASIIYELGGYWSLAEVKSFVEEMRGFSFANNEDRTYFLEFFFVRHGDLR